MGVGVGVEVGVHPSKSPNVGIIQNVEMNVSLSFTRVRAGTLANARGLRLV